MGTTVLKIKLVKRKLVSSTKIHEIKNPFKLIQLPAPHKV